MTSLANEYYDADFVADKVPTVIYLFGDILTTTNIEFRIIGTGLEADENCISKSFLIKPIWGYDELKANSPEVFMSSIKQKLNQK